MSTRIFLDTFNHTVRAQVLTSIERGNTLQNACKFNRVPYTQLANYFRICDQWNADPLFSIEDLANDEQTIYSFYQDISAAQARAEDAHLNIIKTAATKDWKAAKWFLEVRNPAYREATAAQTKAAAAANQLPDNNSSAANRQDNLLANQLDLNLLSTKETELLQALIEKATPGAPSTLDALPASQGTSPKWLTSG